MSVYVADFSFARITPGQIQQSGLAGVMRYTAPGGLSNGKVISPAEFQAFLNSGVPCCLNYEYTTTDIAGGYSGGVAAAEWTEQWAASLGYPANWACYYSVDEGASGAAALPYFEGIQAVAKNPWRCRPYGDALVINAVLDAGIADGGWPTNATSWSQGQVAHVIELYQETGHNLSIPGVSDNQWDENIVYRADWCVAGAAPTPKPTPQEDDMAISYLTACGAEWKSNGIDIEWVATAQANAELSFFGAKFLGIADSSLQCGTWGSRLAGAKPPGNILAALGSYIDTSMAVENEATKAAEEGHPSATEVDQSVLDEYARLSPADLAQVRRSLSLIPA